MESIRNNPIIVIEGLDGVGKTTLVNSLELVLDAVVIKTPGVISIAGEGRPLRELYDKQSESIRRAYYRFACVTAGIKAREFSETVPVIIDRYWTSTVSYAVGAGEDKQTMSFLGKYPDDIIKPDLVIVLTVNEAVRLTRIRKRQDIDSVEESRLASDTVFRERIMNALRSFDIYEIDTSYLAPSEVLAAVVLRIKELN
jgi:UMP-CMP kinase 2